MFADAAECALPGQPGGANRDGGRHEEAKLKEDEKSVPDPAQKHATFLRAVLSLDSSDPNLPRFVPPPPADPAAPETPEPTDQATKARPLFPRVPPSRRSR